MKRKKLLAVVLSVCMVSAFALAGCGESGTGGDNGSGSGGGDTSGNGQDIETQGDVADGSTSGGTGYVFETGGVEIAVDADMSGIEEELGEPSSYFEEPSCAIPDTTAKIYTYSGFEVDTYQDGDKDLVGSIILKDDTVATAEGVDLSMTRDDVIEAYGEEYAEEGTALVYEKDGMTLSFILDGENIASIQYDSSVMK